MSNYKNLLIGEPPLQVLPTLAVKIGLNEAMVLQQLHYWVENPKADGFTDESEIKWIYNSYEKWRANFPFWSEHTIQRIFLNLEKMGLVISAQLSKDTHDKTKYYRIDYAKLELLNMPNWRNPSPQDVALHDANLALCIDESETTTETTTENTTEINEKEISSNPSSKKVPEGFPEPSGDGLGDWLEASRRVEEKNMPMVSVIVALTRGLGYNFPHFGENKGLDRVARLIAADGRDMETFISWAKQNKRDPHWYHVKPDTLWGDWPQAFKEYTNPILERLKNA